MKIRRFDTTDGDYPTPLSGYRAGYLRGGKHVQKLEEAWRDRFEVKHAIACNSATSGLLAASRVCRPRFDHQDIAVPCFTMSATAAAPKIACPNDLFFMDCNEDTFCSEPVHCPDTHVGQIIVTNLFGQAADLTAWRKYANSINACLIEDNSQSPFATTEDGKLAGTVGDVGVFSFNVHKHLQCGEGGMMVTNDGEIAEKLRGFINHGECLGQNVGLNLRMTEICAMIALHQLEIADKIIATRIEIAETLTEACRPFPGLHPPVAKGKHVYYCWALKIDEDRKAFFNRMPVDCPFRAGYVDPLYRLPAFADRESEVYTPYRGISESLHDKSLILYENCTYDPTVAQLKEICEHLKRVGDITLFKKQA